MRCDGIATDLAPATMLRVSADLAMVGHRAVSSAEALDDACGPFRLAAYVTAATTLVSGEAVRDGRVALATGSRVVAVCLTASPASTARIVGTGKAVSSACLCSGLRLAHRYRVGWLRLRYGIRLLRLRLLYGHRLRRRHIADRHWARRVGRSRYRGALSALLRLPERLLRLCNRLRRAGGSLSPPNSLLPVPILGGILGRDGLCPGAVDNPATIIIGGGGQSMGEIRAARWLKIESAQGGEGIGQVHLDSYRARTPAGTASVAVRLLRTGFMRPCAIYAVRFPHTCAIRQRALCLVRV